MSTTLEGKSASTTLAPLLVSLLWHSCLPSVFTASLSGLPVRLFNPSSVDLVAHHAIGPKWGTRVSAVIGCALLTSCAADLGNRKQTVGLLVPGAFFMGMVEGISTTTSTFHLRSQEEIGEGGKLHKDHLCNRTRD